jgi:hypothetical protein
MTRDEEVRLLEIATELDGGAWALGDRDEMAKITGETR